MLSAVEMEAPGSCRGLRRMAFGNVQLLRFGSIRFAGDDKEDLSPAQVTEKEHGEVYAVILPEPITRETLFQILS